ncbi:MAG: hypothetical protein AAF488_18230 [Planctomycetota bacterium]
MKRSRVVVVVCLGGGLIALVLWGSDQLFRYVEAWRLGYYVDWMDDRVSSFEGQPRSLSRAGVAAVTKVVGEEHTAGRWRVGTEFTPLDLGSHGGKSISHAISDSGQILATTGLGRAARAYLVDRSGRVPIEPKGFMSVHPMAMNAAGLVALHAETLSLHHTYRAMTWSRAGGARELAVLFPRGDSYAADISDDGRVVGNAMAADGSRRAVLWLPDGTIRDLGLPPGAGAAYARRICAKRVLVELSMTANDENRIAFWSEGSGFSILRLPHSAPFLFSATDRGDVLYSAGAYKSRTYHIATSGGEVRDLPETIPNDFGRPTHANYSALNERGQVSGYVVWQEGDHLARRGFLLTPVH